MPKGRPTLLTEELVEKARGYLDTCIMELPCKEGLAIYLGVAVSSLYLYAKEDSDIGRDFSEVFDRIMAEQGKRLINGGLYGRFNSTITKLMLSKHGYVEKQETDLTTNGKDLGTGISAEQASQLIRARADRSDT